ncbi:hypothetical protein [Maribellus maritimus]|uniref:hypothetical protein n=1 Tax=Maribellus maritimus TaxID=2870838 RepID=UPI001EEABEBC|nr:hypothetical protein [Maribellus maritimus]MCG6190428.1 hypothetical protein [Maribellus maritimus]
MKKLITATFFLLFIFCGNFYGVASNNDGSQNKDTSKVYFFIKKELNTGVYFSGSNEREEIRTDESKQNEERFTGSAGFQFENRIWNYLSYKQEFIDLTLDIGPFFGVGSWSDSTSLQMVDGDQTTVGLRSKLAVDYSSRFYYDDRNYTLVKVNAWVRDDLFHQSIDGATQDSSENWSDFDEKGLDNKFRYGFSANAGWGMGKLNPMNHYMVADYLLNKYYKGRLFSDEEIERLANKITELKLQRDPSLEKNYDAELSEIVDFLRTSMFLANPEIPQTDWELGEFMPRLSGSRLELGPFFNYYNREPDFYYGGFMQYDRAKYVNTSWNSNFSINLSYNHYKHHDWATLESNIGWTYYPNLKSQFGFGLKYIPGVVIYDWDEFDPVKHNFIPYIEYYRQVNSKTRVNFSFAWKIGDGEEFMMTGPEFSLAIYKSRY